MQYLFYSNANANTNFVGRQHSNFKITKQRLVTHREYMLKEMEPKDIADSLFEAEVFTTDDHDEVTKKQGRKKRGERVLKLLCEKNEDCMDTFLHSLEAKGNREILKRLQSDNPGPHLNGL